MFLMATLLGAVLSSDTCCHEVRLTTCSQKDSTSYGAFELDGINGPISDCYRTKGASCYYNICDNQASEFKLTARTTDGWCYFLYINDCYKQMHWSQTDGTYEENIYTTAWPSCNGACSGTSSSSRTGSPTKNLTSPLITPTDAGASGGSSPANRPSDAGASGGSISTNRRIDEGASGGSDDSRGKIPLLQFFDDPACNQANTPEFYGKWGCNKAAALGGSMFIKQCAEKFLYDWHYRLWPADYECLDSTFQVSAGIEPRKCHKFPLPNSAFWWKVCCGDCGLTDKEITIIIVCSIVIGLFLIIGLIVCYKKKKFCFKETGEVANVMSPGKIAATVTKEICAKEGEVANLMAPSKIATTSLE